MPAYTIDAYNTATDSTNKIHDDEVARRFGFRGGLVPGVDVYAYMTRAAVEHFGNEWLATGGMQARFHQPVYDGDTVTVIGTPADDGTLGIVVVDPTGATCAKGVAVATAPSPEAPVPASAQRPDPVPPASAASLPAGRILGTLHDAVTDAIADQYLADIREVLPIYRLRPIVHPGWLLRYANSVLARSVVLGPWIHVESDVSHQATAAIGQAIEIRAVVLDEFERKGHRFVTLDVSISADGVPVQRITHTAIHTPRPVA